jgi:hypothetical protein
MDIDFAFLGERLTSANLTGKSVNEYSKDEVRELVRACIDALVPEYHSELVSPPYIEDGVLRIPFDSDPKYHWWKGCGQSILETLRELQAPEEVVRKYVRIENITLPF